MSGKAPPKGPRALRDSLPTGQSSPASTSANSQPSLPTPTSPTKKAPPTGPRSLTNGTYNTSQTGAFRGAKPKSMVNGHIPVGPAATNAGNAKPPPTGPSALLGRALDKGKQVERNPVAALVFENIRCQATRIILMRVCSFVAPQTTSEWCYVSQSAYCTC